MTVGPGGAAVGEDSLNGVGGGIGLADDIAERSARYPAGNSSAAGAVSNFVNTIVGAGIIGLPFALAQVLGNLPVATDGTAAVWCSQLLNLLSRDTSLYCCSTLLFCTSEKPLLPAACCGSG